MKEHQQAGVVFESNESLIRFLREWAQHPEALQKMRKASWQLGHDTLNWETESQKLLALVDNILQDAS